MKTWKSLAFVLIAVLVLAEAGQFTAHAAPLPKVTNVSANPTLTNEFYITATNITTTFNGTNVRVLVYMDDPPSGGGATRGIPAPLIELNVGQTVICHFKNNLTNNVEGATIHWHGFELDNDSDGTAVTQDTVFSGQTYTYRFIVPRPGLFWYHSHMIPGTSTYGGMYGPIIVHDSDETALIAANVIPGTNSTFPLVVSDISFTNGTVGKVVSGTNYSLNTLIQLCENSILGLPNGDNSKCSPTGKPGELFLCNGKIPSLAGNYCTPTTNSSPVFYVGKNQRVRLQLYNASVSRTVNFSLHYPCSNPAGNTNLFHIGGQGGFLDRAVLDGGVQSGYDFVFPKGTINLGSGMREDVMFYTSGSNGDVIQLLGRALPDPWKLDTLGILPTNYPIAFFVVTNTASTNAPITNSMPLLAAIGAQVEDLKVLNTNSLAVPTSSSYGTTDGRVELAVGPPSNGSGGVNGPNIGGYAATPLDGNSGYGSWPDVAHPPTALWARAGDVLQLAVANTSASVHPYHLHGFSMQPVAIYSENLQTNLFTYPYNEFEDTIDIHPGQALVFRIKLTDRQIIADSATGGPVTTATDSATGGNVGRWLMHCHIFLHGAIGMISELVVIPNTAYRLVSKSPGTNSVISTSSSSWTGTANDSWLHLAPAYSSGSGHTTVLFTYDTNSGPTRVGTINVGGETVEVTQAGTNYIQAPGPLTGLVTNGINAPFGIAVDDDGDVFFSDSANGAIKRWNKTANTVSTLTSGWSSPYGVGVDRLGNVYFTQYGSTAIKVRIPSFFNFVFTSFTNDTTGVAGLAVDESQNVYIAVPGEHAIKKWTASTSTLSSYTTNGLISPWGVAVDKAGALYASDIGDDSVKKLGIRIVFPFSIIPYWNTFTVLTNLSNPYNLAVDDGGNIFVGDYGHGAIKKLTVASNLVTSVVTGLSAPIGVTVDKTGNIFVADWSGDAIKEQPYAFVSTTPQQEPAEVTVDTLPVVLPPSENLLAPFAPTPNQPWIFYGGSTAGVVQFSVGANLGGPRSSSITVLGVPVPINQDGASWKLAVTNLLVGPAAGSNTVTERVIPSIALWGASTATPWLHLPFVSGTGSGNILFTYDKNTGATRTGTIAINGMTLFVTQAGASYVPALAPATTLVSAGLVSPVDVAPDNSGNVFFGDSGNNTVRKWSPGTVTSSIIMSGFLPQGVDVDDFGNVYASDFGNTAIKQWRAADSNVVTLVDTPYSPSGISVGYGTNIYWAMPSISSHSISEWFAATSNSVVVVSNGLTNPRGVSVDIAGNVYISDVVANALKKWDPVSATLTTLIGSGLNSPWDCVVDGSGNVYVADGFNNRIVEWVAASGTVITNVPGGLGDPTGVGVDANQNIFIADFNNGAVKELPHAFIDATTKFEPFTAGNDSLATVLPMNQNLTASFAPTDNAAWLTITSVVNGVISFSFTQNPNTVSRNANISVLGQNVVVSQSAAPPVPIFSQINLLSNGVVRFNFTNTVAGGPYTVLFTTNLMTPTPAWSVLGPATPLGGDLWQFTDISASNNARFYRIRTP